MSDERDEVVARALADLPVPDHRPGFWARLDGAVAAADAAPGPSPAGDRRLATGELPAVTDLGPERTARRSRRAPMLAAAAALVVLAGAVGVVLAVGGDGDDEGELAQAPPATGTSAPDDETETTAATLESTEPAVTTTDPPSAAATSSPQEAVRTWLEALGEGETEDAAALLGPRTIRHLEQIGADPEGLMQESQEGYGAWMASPDLEISATEVGPVELLGSDLAIVTVTGTFTGEGESGHRIDVIPAVRGEDGWRIEHLAHNTDQLADQLVFTVPGGSEGRDLGGMNPADDINVFVPANGVVYFSIDGTDPHVDDTSIVADEPFALYNPRTDLEPGTHQLVVVAVGDDDTITAFAGTFVVEA